MVIADHCSLTPKSSRRFSQQDIDGMKNTRAGDEWPSMLAEEKDKLQVQEA